MYIWGMVVRKRLDIKGRALVFVTATIHEWTPIFRADNIALAILNKLGETTQYFGVALVGNVLMPTHLHLLLGFKRIELLSKFMQSFKILSSKAVKGLLSDSFRDRLNANGKFRMWKPRFDDLIIYTEEQFRVKLNYIHYNPVRGGLVDSPIAWPYTSAGDWLENKPGLLPIDKNFEWLN